MVHEIMTALAEHRAEKAQRLKDHQAREAMLDALYLNFWDEELAWDSLVQTVAIYTREKPRGQ